MTMDIHTHVIVAGSLTITITPPEPPLVVMFSPLSPTVRASAAPGTVVAAITVSGGNGNPVTLALSGDTTDFALSALVPPASLVVGPNGISTANWPAQGTTKVILETVTASQL
jgi:hypothetical protein